MVPEDAAGRRIGAYQMIRSLAERPGKYLVRAADDPTAPACEASLVAMPEGGLGRVVPRLEQYASLTHPALERLLAYFDHEGELALVLERVEGLSLERLRSYLDRDDQPLPHAARWLVGWRMMGALAQAHSARDAAGRLAPLVHGCMSPRSVLVTWAGGVRVRGLCPWLDAAAELSARATPTRVWLAPEVRRGDDPSAKSDAFGAAMIMRELLTGRPPPARGVSFEPLTRTCPDIPGDVARALDRALDVSPRLRPSCAELAQRFAGLVHETVAVDALRESTELYRALSGLWSMTAPPLEMSRPSTPEPPEPPEPRDPGLSGTTDEHRTAAGGGEAPRDVVADSGQSGASESEPPRTSRSPVASNAPPAGPPASPSEPPGEVPQEADERPPEAPLAPAGSLLRWAAFGVLAIAAALFAWHRRGSDSPQTAHEGAAVTGTASASVSRTARAVRPARTTSRVAPSAGVSSSSAAGGSGTGGSATAAGRTASGEPDLLSYQGYLTVKSGVDAEVYVKGLPVGRTNRKNKVRCRPRFVRIGLSPGPRWIGEGRTVYVPCGGQVVVTMDPDPDLMPPD